MSTSNTTAQVLTLKKLNIHKTSGSLLLHSSSNFKCWSGRPRSRFLRSTGKMVLNSPSQKQQLKFLATTASGTAQTTSEEIYTSDFKIHIKGTKHFHFASTSLVFQVKLTDSRAYCSKQVKVDNLKLYSFCWFYDQHRLSIRVEELHLLLLQGSRYQITRERVAHLVILLLDPHL